MTAGGGNVDQGFGTVQYGGAVAGTDYRVWSKYFNQDHFPGTNGEEGADGWHVMRGGFRTDSTLGSQELEEVLQDYMSRRLVTAKPLEVAPQHT